MKMNKIFKTVTSILEAFVFYLLWFSAGLILFPVVLIVWGVVMSILRYAGLLGIVEDYYLVLLVLSAILVLWCIYFYRNRERLKRKRIAELKHEIITMIELEMSSKITSPTGIEFVLIPAGEFDMGSPDDEKGRRGAEGPVHRVKISKPFYLGKYPVTQKQWREIMGNNPSYFYGCDDCPVEWVSWNDAQKFIKKLNEKEGTDKYRLPTEAEWEYATRAGTKTRYSFGNDESKLGEYAWYTKNSDVKTHPVGQKEPNPWGLYDMHGNVWEWVQDRWHYDYNGAPTDGSAWESGSFDSRVTRGGGWYNVARYCRSANRNYYSPDYRKYGLGFRLASQV